MTIMQGDQYKIPFSLTDAKGKVLTDQYVKDIEICVGKIRYTKPDVTYNANLKVWEFPLTQEESFSLVKKYVPIQLRIQTFDNNIIGVDLGEIQIFDSISKEFFEDD